MLLNCATKLKCRNPADVLRLSFIDSLFSPVYNVSILADNFVRSYPMCKQFPITLFLLGCTFYSNVIICSDEDLAAQQYKKEPLLSPTRCAIRV